MKDVTTKAIARANHLIELHRDLWEEAAKELATPCERPLFHDQTPSRLNNMNITEFLSHVPRADM